MYNQTKRITKGSEVQELKSSSILWGRLSDGTFSKYLGKDSRFNFLQDKKIIINGKDINLRLKEIIDFISNQYYYNFKNANYICVTGHADVHRGNILYRGNEVFFIDTEYSDSGIPLEIEFTKQYYNDLFGFMFFSNDGLLQKIFSKPNIFFDDTSVIIENFQIKDKSNLNFLFNIMQSRVDNLRVLSDEFAIFDKELFKRLILLCHFLTKDPNSYTHEKFAIFITIAVCIFNNDPTDFKEFKRSLFNF